MEHYHVTVNVPGVSPDGGRIFCVPEIKNALSVTLASSRWIMWDVAEGCDRDHCGFCPWCQAAARVNVSHKPCGAVEADLRSTGVSEQEFRIPLSPALATVKTETINMTYWECRDVRLGWGTELCGESPLHYLT